MQTAQQHASSIGILGTGSHLPANAVDNTLVGSRAGVTAEWIHRKTGISERRYAAEGEATSDLAAHAARAALADAGIRPGQLDHIVVATSTPDHPQPATAAIVQDLIGAEQAAAFDLNSVCSGFAFALHTAHRLIADGGHALVIGADVYSRIIDPTDRRTAILFGDGAGAVVLGPVPAGYGIETSLLETFGRHHRTIRVPAGGSRRPASPESLAEGDHWFAMNGREVREFVTDRLPLTVKELLRRADRTGTEVDHFVPHQANGQMLAEILPSLGLERARTHLTVAEYGNTGAASVPITLDAANRAGALRDGELVLLSGFGGGMSIGSNLLRWHAAA
ncbi:3-oxoacyl-ACP synthase III family protein [Kitasatospora sp. NPDC059160]|uniref:3-oxoacyl-ACP synthase III family protein n=1 Tax=Kitasatospora sp. NPDC059160 TaxID=3346748 RepID=UPI0036862732